MLNNSIGNINLNKINVILHAEDIGMFQSSIDAFADLCTKKKLLSGSVMAPCPWFLPALKLQQRLPQADLGLHLTLTSEWDNYRWSPVAPTSIKEGLVDTSGFYFHQSCQQVCQHASIEGVTKELTAQIELAKRMGFAPTHLDGHMFVCQQTKFLPNLLKLSLEYQIPAVISYQQLYALPEQDAQHWEQKLKALGLPIFNQITRLAFPAGGNNNIEYMRSFFKRLSPGLHYLYAHPVKASSELSTLGHQANNRVAEFDALMNLDLYALAAEQNIRLCTFNDFL